MSEINEGGSEIHALTRRLDNEEIVDSKTFGEICERLLSESAIVSGDSQLESRLYDAAILIKEDLAAYFSVMRLRLVHYENGRYFRLYPPQATSPGASQEGDTDREATALFRRPIGPGVGGLLYCLRVLFTQGVMDGRMQGPDVETDLGEINITLKNKLGRDPLPLQQRQAAFRELTRHWRVVRYDTKSNLDDPGTKMLIRPIICDLVAQERAQAVLDSMAKLSGDEHSGQGEAEATEENA